MAGYNLADLFERVTDAVPDRIAVVDATGARRTYAALDERSTRLAHALTARAGEHVGLCLHNSIAHVELMLACYKRASVPINVNWRYTDAELQYVSADADLVQLWRDDDVASPDYDALVASGSAERDFPPRSGDDHYVLYTGGTTGQPKGVVWRHEDIFFGALGGGNPGGPPIARPDEIVASVRDNPAQRLRAFLPPGDPGPPQFISLGLGPLVHASGQWSALGALLGGGKVVLYCDPHVDIPRVVDLIARERVNSLNPVGDASARPLADYLRAHPDHADTSSLRLLGSGGSMLSQDVKDTLLGLLPSVLAIVEGIGSSESPAQAVAVIRRDGTVPPSLTFSAKPETMVVDDELTPIARGSGRVGRLATRGRVPLGYYKDAERTARTFVEIDGVRWVLTGDLATIDADGTLRFLGRGSASINTGGEKVYPEEVEGALKSHPAIADAVVAGIPDPRWGQKVAAVLQLRPTAAIPTRQEIEDHLAPLVARYKLPRFTHVVPSIERSPSGKPDYRWATEILTQAAEPTHD